MRDLTKALTVVSLLAPVSGYSLGIGDIKVRSALNQNLNAEIRLVVSPNEKPDSIKVNLAPPERFDAAGVSWSYFLSKIRFKPIVKPNGSVIVKVTSTEALKEPYLNFLLEVSWPKGNLYREFTVLVDPPAEYQEPAYQAAPSYEPYYPQEEVYAQPRPRPVARHQVNRPRYRPNPAGNFGGQVVARRNDTLWKVAARARGGSAVSVEQMMMALYDENPSAFFEQNVNALSAGKTLKVPAKNVVQQLTRQQALAEFDRHNEAWRNHTPVPATEETQVAKEQAVDNQLKLVAPTESTVAGGETVAPSSEQGGVAKQSATTTGVTAGQVEPGQTAAKESKPVVDQAVQTKLDALQKQLETMQQIIELKDKQLADLQKAGEAKPEIITTPVSPSTQPVPSAEVKPSEEIKPVPNEPVPPIETVASQRPGEPPVEQVKSAEQPKPVAKPIIAPEPVVKESDSSYFGIIGAMVLTLMSLLGWMWWRKQKMMEETDAESMFGNYSILRNNETQEKPSATGRKAAAGGTAAAGGALAEESSFLNDFKASDFESFESFNVDHGDIDPVAEADVYLAYGRYQQAEDLMKQAVSDSPERDECKLKLLEIYQVSGNKDAFDTYAAELAASGKKEDKDFWDKVIDLSKEITENPELFTPTSAPAVFATDVDSVAENVLISPVEAEKIETKSENHKEAGVANFDSYDTDELETEFETNIPPFLDSSKEKFTANAELNNGQPSKDVDNYFAVEKEEPPLDNEPVNFDLGPYPGNSDINFHRESSSDNSHLFTNKKTSSHPGESQLGSELESYDFDFDLIKNDNNKSQDTNKIEVVDSWDPDQTIDFSFDDKPGFTPADNNPTLDFNFDIDTPSSTSELVNKSEGVPVSDLTDMDEIETKLDLAKAYIDMGDTDSAKDIIMQVLETGSGEQKKSAQQLLKELEI